MQGEFYICQFFTDGTYEYVRRYLTLGEAVKAFAHYTSNVAVKMGIIEKVIITDGGDCTNVEWTKDRGITYPPEMVGISPAKLYKALHSTEESN